MAQETKQSRSWRLFRFGSIQWPNNIFEDRFFSCAFNQGWLPFVVIRRGQRFPNPSLLFGLYGSPSPFLKQSWGYRRHWLDVIRSPILELGDRETPPTWMAPVNSGENGNPIPGKSESSLGHRRGKWMLGRPLRRWCLDLWRPVKTWSHTNSWIFSSRESPR